jgi:Bucentaur or craniofacial development
MLNVRCRKVEKKPRVDISAATVDVDALWAEMVSGKTKPKEPENDPSGITDATIEPRGSLSPNASRNGLPSEDVLKEAPSKGADEPDSMIMIKRTYNFAGQVHTEQKLVPRDSAEAKLFLASQDGAADPATEDTSLLLVKPKRPTKRARRSVFEPIMELPQRTDLYFGARKDTGVEITAVGKDAKKLNTVEKSAMDWAGFVDKEGIKDDLTAAGKSKGAYRARQEFLARVEQKKDEEARRARGVVL